MERTRIKDSQERKIEAYSKNQNTAVSTKNSNQIDDYAPATDFFKVVMAATLVVLMICVTVIITPTDIMAAEWGRIRPSPEKLLDRITAELGLSEKQQAEMAPIIEAEIEKRLELMNKFRTEEKARRESIRAAMAAIEQKRAIDFSNILTEEQMEQYNQLIEAQKRMIEERRVARDDHRDRKQMTDW